MSEYSADRLGPLRGSLKDELAEAIASARGGKGAGAMAYELLRRDKRSHQLVGVIRQGRKVAFYEPSCWSLVAAPFDESGVDGKHQSQWEKLEYRVQVERFVRKKGEGFWTWVHPRYRWVFDVGDSRKSIER